MDSAADAAKAAPNFAPGGSVVYFDGLSSRRRLVAIGLADRLEIREAEGAVVAWPYADIRRADSAPGVLRVSCLSAPPLARLELRDAALAAELAAHCPKLDENRVDGRSVAGIVGWSLAATLSIIGVVLFAVPLAADRLAPLVPQAFERRLGDAGEVQLKAMFGGRVCKSEAGQLAFSKLVNAVREAAGLDPSVQSAVLATPVPNAFALPGGRVYLFEGLLKKAESPDEIAGVLAHELGHLKHRDSIRELLHNSGSSFLIGLLFGDVTGSSAVIFASRSLLTASYSRDAERNADSFAIEIMHRLGRSPRPLGDLLFRVTGKESNSSFSILASHPLTEDRLQRMKDEDRPPSGPPLLTATEWQSLKSICRPGAAL
ncbi:M48 family metallopeptidase [Bradyrhizobium sp.]|uniref:M48 family metallopeptidase n=1 Tax=Bradyrhizobium sp. TaxID=376 RepID=UPI003C5CA294